MYKNVRPRSISDNVLHFADVTQSIQVILSFVGVQLYAMRYLKKEGYICIYEYCKTTFVRTNI